MPLPSDEKLIQLANDLLQAFDNIFGVHSGFRPAHAKGVLLTGTFTPSAEARSLTRAPHATRESTSVTVRFSNSTGLPTLPDNDPNADPRGIAIRFHLAEHAHTDIIGHSANGFPTRTAREFLDFLWSVAATATSKETPNPVEKFLASHPSALAFVQMPKPAPASFATERYFGVTALRFINSEGQERYGRYRIVPDAGVQHISDVSSRLPNYLFDELSERIATGPIRLHIQVQIPNEGDVVDDATKQWPEDRKLLPFGSIQLTAKVPGDAHEQKKIIFDPIPRVDGIDPSDDPLLELRAALYLLSGRRRRQAPEQQGATTA